jgi:hypothetical protein
MEGRREGTRSQANRRRIEDFGGEVWKMQREIDQKVVKGESNV